MSIHIVEASLVKPATPTTRHVLELTGADLYWSESPHSSTVHFLKIRKGHELGAIVQSLKRSLSTLLTHFYPVAGRLVYAPERASNVDDERDHIVGDRQLVLDCNDAGVEFIEAFCSDVDFGQLQLQQFAMQDFFGRLVRTALKWLHPDDPLASVQVTSFPGGGMAIGCSCNHTLFDGFSFASLMKCWAEIDNGAPQLSAPPQHMRRQLPYTSAWAPRRSAPPADVSSSAHAAPYMFEQQVRLFPVTASIVEKLRDAAEADAATSLTSFECLAAHVWRARTKAAMMTEPHGKDLQALLGFRVNIRSRLVPKLPPNSFGPAIILAQVGPLTAEQLLWESLGATASRIHEAALLYTKPSKIQEELDRYARGYRAMELEEHGDAQKMVVTEISDIRRVGFNDVQFHWGKLEGVRPASAMGYGVFSFSPPDENNTFQLIIRLARGAMEAFMSSLLSAPWPAN